MALACLNLALATYVILWVRKVNLALRQLASKYHALAQKYEGAFRALDQATRTHESSSENLRRITQEFSKEFVIDDTMVRDVKKQK